MFISKKKLKNLEERICGLEQRPIDYEVVSYDFGRVNLQKLVKVLPDYIKKAVLREKTASKNTTESAKT